MYRIEFSRAAAKTLRRLPRNTADFIRSRIEAVAADPHAQNNNLKKLIGRPGYRLRVGDWRVIYDLDDVVRVLGVERIAPRGGAYS
ncbi:MAG TPA: type II toxin-antitoxin system RelE/ParE family toxin [Alphaproteobacteria bacterium]|nr:type II toxin-antitoxin system RelE/ParE family toxin [Alphaproteobacteria bacterium]